MKMYDRQIHIIMYVVESTIVSVFVYVFYNHIYTLLHNYNFINIGPL